MNSKNLKYLVHFVAVSLLALLSSPTFSQVFVNADGTTDPYKALNDKGWYEEETSLHPGVKHITQQWNDALKKYVFAFTIHKDVDGDGSERIDRQRLEIKTYGRSPDNMKAAYGETHTYRWKFKLDAGFQPSPSFCHIHQLKAGDGDDAGSPLITITPRTGNPDKLQIIFVAPTAAGGGTTYLKEVELAPFKGTWVEVQEKVTFAHNGDIDIVIRRVDDETVLLRHHSDLLDLWRGTATFIRPKFGIYRSLNNVSYLRDETVLFADFSLYEGTDFTAPVAPSGLEIAPVAGNQLKLTWKDNSVNEDLFRIEISEDGNIWKYFATVPADSSNYTTSGFTAGKTYWFRVRTENVAGNSTFSNAANYSQVTGMVPGRKVQSQFRAWFNNGFLYFSYNLPQKQPVRLSLHSMQGHELFSVTGDSGQGECQNACPVDFLTEGIYIAHLAARNFSGVQKLYFKK
jgi:hypothetical protein